MSDIQAVLLACLVWIGTLVGEPVPIVVAVVLAGGALVMRSPSVLLIAGLLLGLSAGARAQGDYRMVASGDFDGLATAVGLPDPTMFGERVDVKLPSGQRVELSVSPAAGSLRSVRAGDRLRVEGSLRPIDDTPWHRSRHLVGRLTARRCDRIGSGSWPWRMAAAIQELVENASAPLGERRAALYRGLVTGDDRDQGPAQRAIFRKVGLSHILAVSGQNVAFVLVLTHMLLGFVPRRARPPVVGAVLCIFALVTQLEPSVLRATATAGIGYWAVVSGRAGSGIRLLSLAVAALLVVDPFLGRSVGFQLSVGAAAGILLLGPSLSHRLPGPAWFAVPCAVTVSAQLAVTPLLLRSFGEVSLVALPANLLAGWAAGLVMMWGMSGGLLAGLIGGSLGEILQLPVGALLWWIDTTAASMAALGVPPLEPVSATLLLAASMIAALLGVRLGPLAVLIVVTIIVAWPHPGAVEVLALEGGGTLIGIGDPGAVLVLDAGTDQRVVGAILENKPAAIDVVVVTIGHRGVSTIVREIRSLVDIGVVLAPPHHTVVGGVRVLDDVVLDTSVGPVTVEVESDDRLSVTVPKSP